MLAWIVTGIATLLAAGAMVRFCLHWQTRCAAASIHAAIAAADPEELRSLLLAGNRLGLVRAHFGEPALIVAVRSSAIEIVELLLSHGAAADETGIEWRTALMHAAASGDRELCSLLLSRGADPQMADSFGSTAADWAETAGYSELARVLRRAPDGRSIR
jgi:ankyrin repeat protein